MQFHFRGCGWKQKALTWVEEEFVWIRLIDRLFTMTFGDDNFIYEYGEKKTCMVALDSCPTFTYEREEWQEEYQHMVSGSSCEGAGCLKTILEYLVNN